MMNFTIPAVFAAGAALGFLTPGFARDIAQYKCVNKNNELSPGQRYTSFFLRLPLGIMNAFVWALAAIQMENLNAALLLSVLFTTALIIALIDFRIRIVPNELVLVVAITGLVFQWVRFGLSALLLSGVCLVAMMVLFAVVAGIVGFGKVGAGDVKLAGAMGLSLGYPGIITALIIMSAALILCSLLGLLSGKLTLHAMIPLAPFMMLGMAVSLLCVVYPIAFPVFVI